MKRPVYDLVLGNLEGSRDPGDPDPKWTEECGGTGEGTGEVKVTSAMQTRSQKRAEGKLTRPLKVPDELVEVMTPEKLKSEQDDDGTLKRCRYSADQGHERLDKNGRRSRFVVLKDILYREFQSPKVGGNDVVHQVVVPCRLRPLVMKIAHGSLLGHQGVYYFVVFTLYFVQYLSNLHYVTLTN